MKTFQTAAMCYLEHQKLVIKKSSYETYYQWICNHLIPDFGRMECAMIKKVIYKNLSMIKQIMED